MLVSGYVEPRNGYTSAAIECEGYGMVRYAQDKNCGPKFFLQSSFDAASYKSIPHHFPMYDVEQFPGLLIFKEGGAS